MLFWKYTWSLNGCGSARAVSASYYFNAKKIRYWSRNDFVYESTRVRVTQLIAASKWKYTVVSVYLSFSRGGCACVPRPESFDKNFSFFTTALDFDKVWLPFFDWSCSGCNGLPRFYPKNELERMKLAFQCFSIR